MSSPPSTSHVPVITKKRRTLVVKDRISQPLLSASTTLFALQDLDSKEVISPQRSRVSLDVPPTSPPPRRLHKRRGSEPANKVFLYEESEKRVKSPIGKPKIGFLRRSIAWKGKEELVPAVPTDDRGFLFRDGREPLQTSMSLDNGRFNMEEFGFKLPDAPENIEDVWSEWETTHRSVSRPKSDPTLAKRKTDDGKMEETRPLLIRRKTGPTGHARDGQSIMSLVSPVPIQQHPLVETPQAYSASDYFSQPLRPSTSATTPRGDEEETGSDDGSLLEISEVLAHLNIASLEEEILSELHPKTTTLSSPRESRGDLDSFIAFDDPSMEMDEDIFPLEEDVLPESPALFNSPRQTTKFNTLPASLRHSPRSLFSHTNSSVGSLLSQFPVFVHEEPRPRPRSLFPKRTYTKRRNAVRIADYLDYACLASQMSTPDSSFRVLEPDVGEREVGESRLRSVFED